MFVMSKILQKCPALKIFIDISKKKNINLINNILNTKYEITNIISIIKKLKKLTIGLNLLLILLLLKTYMKRL